MAEGAAAAAVVGTVMEMQAQGKEAEAQARAARENAKNKRLQALELLDRLEINNQKLIQEGEEMKANQMVSQASRGLDVGSGASLSLIEETNSLISRQLKLDAREAKFKADQLRAGADSDLRLAGDIRSAAKTKQFATFLKGAGTVAGAM